MFNRSVKENKQTNEKQIYIRDAQGNVMSIYKDINDSLILEELHLYGSQRLGIIKENRLLAKYVNIFPPSSPLKINTPNTPYIPAIPKSIGGSITPITPIPLPYNFVHYYFGKKHYELTDWLGNVRVVINDKKTPQGTNPSDMTYAAQVLEVNDYYPFGMLSRNYFVSEYRYGFNRKEMDNEVYGITSSWYDYGLRPYNALIGRPPCPDPLAKKFPNLSPYQFFNNNPIKNIDLDGAEDVPNEIYESAKRAGMNMIKKATAYVIGKSVEATIDYAKYKIESKLDMMVSSNDPKTISAGLFGEFITGLGPEHRDFGPNNPMTQDIAKSRLTEQARKLFYEQNKEALEKRDFKNVKPVEKVFEFGITGLLTEGTNAQQFVGSAKYTITLGEDKKSLNFTIYNETSEESFMYHNKVPGIKGKSHKREEGAIMGTISQTFTFTEPLKTEEKKK